MVNSMGNNHISPVNVICKLLVNACNLSGHDCRLIPKITMKLEDAV